MPILSNFPGGSGNGGGLALAAVSNIKYLEAGGKVYISWTDPEDMVVAESVLASWGGTLLVRKAGSAPTSRRDGVIVLDSKERNQYADGYFCDSGLSDGTTYYYKFFPYTTAGTYTESDENLFTATPTAQVDGIDDWKATDIVVSEEAGDGKMTIQWSDPAAEITSDGVTLASWGSTTVVVTEGDYATSKDDESAVYTLKETTRNQYVSTPLTVSGLTNGKTYYVRLFPETTDGGINDSAEQQGSGKADRITIAQVPAQSGSLTYDGNVQSPVWDHYSEEQLTVSGATVGTNAGSYQAAFTPTQDYRWADGSADTKSVTWQIDKAPVTLTIDPESLTLDMTHQNGSITVTRNGDGVISAVSDQPGIVKVSVSGNTVSVNNVNMTNGTANITISVSETQNYTASESKICKVTTSFISNVLNDNSWAVISSVSSTGSSYWAVGDRKKITINGVFSSVSISYTSYYVFIIGFNHNSNREGTGITFQGFKTALNGGIDICLVDGYYGSNPTSGAKRFNMNHWWNTSYYGSNFGGWKGCDLRYDILGSTDKKPSQYGSIKSSSNVGYDASTTTATNPVANTLMAALPSDLRSVMKPMTIYTDNKGNSSNVSSNVTKSVDYLPLLSEYEIFGTRSYANQYEQNYQQQYAYYKAGNSRVKYKYNSTGSTAYWWERSPYYLTASTFCSVRASGSASYDLAYNSYGLAPAFRV